MDVDYQTEFNTSADNWCNLQAHSPSLVSGSGFFWLCRWPFYCQTHCYCRRSCLKGAEKSKLVNYRPEHFASFSKRTIQPPHLTPNWSVLLERATRFELLGWLSFSSSSPGGFSCTQANLKPGTANSESPAFGWLFFSSHSQWQAALKQQIRMTIKASDPWYCMAVPHTMRNWAVRVCSSLPDPAGCVFTPLTLCANFAWTRHWWGLSFHVH